MGKTFREQGRGKEGAIASSPNATDYYSNTNLQLMIICRFNCNNQPKNQIIEINERKSKTEEQQQ